MATWTQKTNNVNSYDADHVNDLQDEKLDRDGQIPATGAIQWDKGADVASASTLALGNDGNYFDVTGTTGITGITQTAVGGNKVQAGTVVKLHFDGAVTITHSANLYLPGAANLTVAANDELEFTCFGTDQWRCTGGRMAALYGSTVTSAGAVMATTTVSGTTAKLSSLTDACMPYRVDDSTGLADSGHSIIAKTGGVGWNMSLGTMKIFTYVNDALADDATVTLPESTSGICIVSAGADGAAWTVANDGSTSLIANNTGSGAAADADTKLCVYDGGLNTAIVKNRLGSAKEVRIVYFYN